MQQKSLNSCKVFGFSLLRNGVKYDYSFIESLKSLSPIVDKVYLALDAGDDTTEDEIKKLSFVKIIPSKWDMSLKHGLVLSVETNKALSVLRSDEKNGWGIYLQADEVLHEEDYELLKRDIEKAEVDGFDAISFRYLHFWQTHHHVAISKKWYPNEIRAIKLNTEIESWGDAQGFRNYKKIYYSDARIFHYGHVRDQSVYEGKMRDMAKLYHSQDVINSRLEKGFKEARKNKCILYFGTHPKTMKDRILRMNDIWQLPEKEEVTIIGDKNNYSSDLINQINAKKIIWTTAYKKDAVITHPTIIDRLLKRTSVPQKMKSKLAKKWTHNLLFIFQLSEKGIGMKER
jgi:hypothetical protein